MEINNKYENIPVKIVLSECKITDDYFEINGKKYKIPHNKEELCLIDNELSFMYNSKEDNTNKENKILIKSYNKELNNKKEEISKKMQYKDKLAVKYKKVEKYKLNPFYLTNEGLIFPGNFLLKHLKEHDAGVKDHKILIKLYNNENASSIILEHKFEIKEYTNSKTGLKEYKNKNSDFISLENIPIFNRDFSTKENTRLKNNLKTSKYEKISKIYKNEIYKIDIFQIKYNDDGKEINFFIDSEYFILYDITLKINKNDIEGTYIHSYDDISKIDVEKNYFLYNDKRDYWKSDIKMKLTWPYHDDFKGNFVTYGLEPSISEITNKDGKKHTIMLSYGKLWDSINKKEIVLNKNTLEKDKNRPPYGTYYNDDEIKINTNVDVGNRHFIIYYKISENKIHKYSYLSSSRNNKYFNNKNYIDFIKILQNYYNFEPKTDPNDLFILLNYTGRKTTNSGIKFNDIEILDKYLTPRIKFSDLLFKIGSYLLPGNCSKYFGNPMNKEQLYRPYILSGFRTDKNIELYLLDKNTKRWIIRDFKPILKNFPKDCEYLEFEELFFYDIKSKKLTKFNDINEYFVKILNINKVDKEKNNIEFYGKLKNIKTDFLDEQNKVKEYDLYIKLYNYNNEFKVKYIEEKSKFYFYLKYRDIKFLYSYKNLEKLKKYMESNDIRFRHDKFVYDNKYNRLDIAKDDVDWDKFLNDRTNKYKVYDSFPGFVRDRLGYGVHHFGVKTQNALLYYKNNIILDNYDVDVSKEVGKKEKQIIMINLDGIRIWSALYKNIFIINKSIECGTNTRYMYKNKDRYKGTLIDFDDSFNIVTIETYRFNVLTTITVYYRISENKLYFSEFDFNLKNQNLYKDGSILPPTDFIKEMQKKGSDYYNFFGDALDPYKREDHRDFVLLARFQGTEDVSTDASLELNKNLTITFDEFKKDYTGIDTIQD